MFRDSFSQSAADLVHLLAALAKVAAPFMGSTLRKSDASATPWLAVASDPAAAIGCAADDVTERAGMAAVGRASDSIAAATRKPAK